MATLYNIFTYTYLLTYLYENFGCVKKFGHTSYGLHSFYFIFLHTSFYDDIWYEYSSGSGSVHEFPLSVG